MKIDGETVEKSGENLAKIHFIKTLLKLSVFHLITPSFSVLTLYRASDCI